MCELLALSSSRPVRLTFSLHSLAARGSLGGRTHDGWGVAFHRENDVALFREPAAAGDSALVRFLESDGPPTDLVISHIRRATRGTVSLANTQPFVRELGGRMHTFAHNGDLPGIWRSVALALGTQRPVGETDSEQAFCALLARLAGLWASGHTPPLQERLGILATFAAELRVLGPANFLYSDGDALFAHGHRRIQAGSGRVEPPGLWTRQRHCRPAEPMPECDAGVSIPQGEQTVLWITSVPLTSGLEGDTGASEWRPVAEGELIAVRAGERIATWSPKRAPS